MRILVSGGTGLVGAAVARELVQHGHEVHALSRKAREPSDGIQFVRGDVMDTASLPALEVDCVFHFASAPTEEQGSPAYIETDVRGARNLFERYPHARFFYASSIWVYGSSPDVLGESSPLDPVTGLGTTKRAVEDVLAGSDRVTILRIGAIYPGGAFERQVIAPARRGLLAIPGGDDNVFGVASIDDVARAFVFAAEHDLRGVFNLVDDHPIGWREVGDVLRQHFSRCLRLRVPRLLIRWFKGRDLASYVSANLHVSNARLTEAGFVLRHPSFADGVRALVSRPAP